MGGIGSGRKPSPCGTKAKYDWHRRRDEWCEECRLAENERARERYSWKKVHGPPAPKGHRKRNKRRMIIEEKLRRAHCLDCKLPVTVDNYFVFDFDHRNPAHKSFTISHNYWNVSQTVLANEMSKCDMVCANCHRMRTHNKKHHLLQLDR